MGQKLFYGVPVYTMDHSKSVQEALVVDMGRIIFTGDMDEALRLYPEAERVELKGGCLLPGFFDTHLHLRDFSLLFTDLDLTSLRDWEEILKMIEEVVRGKKEDEWIVAGGAEAVILDGVTRHDLESVSPLNPVILYGRDLHSVLVNSVALRASGIDEFRQNPVGGTIVRDKGGRLTGLLRERAVDIVRRVKPPEKIDKLLSAIERGMGRLLKYGITGFCDCSINEPQSLLGILMRIWRNGGLHQRAVVMFGDRDAYRLGTLGVQSGFGNEFLRIGGCKFILDGSLSSRTAYMSRPYRGGESCGMPMMDEQELYQVLKRSSNSFFWSAIHAIGDKANEIALNSFERIGKEKESPKLIRRIEHAQTLKDVDVVRFALLDVMAVVNPVHIPFDRENALRYMGDDAKLLHRLKSLYESGASLAIASDAPAGSVDPFRGIYAAVERRDFDEGPELRFFPKEKLSLDDAVYAYTMGGARAVGVEDKLGSIESGKYADFIHISRDIFREGISALKEVEVLQTWVDGEVVYEKIVDKPHITG
ncbi:MAG: amidohydrolase [Spirochaetota bacterium]